MASYVARLLNETARMVHIMGGEVVLTGMQPMVALTLVEMGREIIGVATAIDLEAGVAGLRKLIRARNTLDPAQARGMSEPGADPHEG